MAAQENDLERRAREADEREGRRPLQERWWWFCVITAVFWLRVVAWALSAHHSRSSDVLALTALVFLLAATPAWVWARRRGQRKRAGTAARGTTAQAQPNDPGS